MKRTMDKISFHNGTHLSDWLTEMNNQEFKVVALVGMNSMNRIKLLAVKDLSPDQLAKIFQDLKDNLPGSGTNQKIIT